VPSTPDAAALAARLRRLPLEIQRVDVDVTDVEVPSYGDEFRPTSIVTLSGNGASGRGEHVGWTREAHTRFRDRAADALLPTTTTVGDLCARWHERFHEAYDAAAVEAAAIDLALRQADASLASLADRPAVETRYVVSFATSHDPVEDLARVLGASTVQAKIDVDPDWEDSIFDALAATGRVAILDWKRTGTRVQHEAAHERLPDALFEDPGPAPCNGTPAIAGQRSLDGPFIRADALAPLPRPVAANVKPARMGGVLEALDGVAWCQRHGVAVYFGGMFEIGPGRRQLLALASLLAPDGPNDIAPIPRTPHAPSWRDRLVPPKGPGFGVSAG